MGTNSKLHVQFTDRHWSALGNNGDTYADTGYQNTWEVTAGQAGQRGDPRRLHRRRTSARASAAARRRSAAQQFLAQIEPVLPGISARSGTAGRRSTTGRRTRGRKGSYSYWKVGQYTTFAGAECERGQLPLLRRAYLHRLPGLPQRRGGDRPARGGRRPRRSEGERIREVMAQPRVRGLLPWNQFKRHLMTYGAYAWRVAPRFSSHRYRGFPLAGRTVRSRRAPERRDAARRDGSGGAIRGTAGKLFGAAYALYAGLVFIGASAVAFAPLLHRLIHKLHLEEAEGSGE